MFRNSFFLLPFVLCSFNFTHLLAQKGKSSFLDLGINGSANSYIGDFQPNSKQIVRVNPGVGLSINFGKGGHFRHVIGFGRQALSAQRPDSIQLRVVEGIEYFDFFQTKLNYIHYQLQYRVFRYAKISPFLGSGIGCSQFTSSDRAGINLGTNLYTRTESDNYKSLTYYFPFMFGVDWSINRLCSFQVDYTYHYLGTDYIDNIGQLGNPATKDAFHSLKASVLFRIIQPEKNLSPIFASSDSPKHKEEKVKEEKVKKVKEEKVKEEKVKEEKVKEEQVKEEKVKEEKVKEEKVKEEKVKEEKVKEEKVKEEKVKEEKVKEEKVKEEKVKEEKVKEEKVKEEKGMSAPFSENTPAWVKTRMLEANSPILRLRRIEPLDSPAIQSSLTTMVQHAMSKKKYFSHTLQFGETVEDVAKAYKLPFSLLLLTNPGLRLLRPGDKLKIPMWDE